MTNHEFSTPPTTTTYDRGCRCPECKEAHNAYMRQWRKHRTPDQIEQARQYLSDYYQKNRGRHKARAQSWNERNKEKIRAYEASRRQTPERKKQRKESRLRCREQHSLTNAAWYAANKERVKANVVRWQSENADKVSVMRHKRRAHAYGAEGSHTTLEWQNILVLFEYRCAHCGASQNLTKDHIIPLSKGGSNYASNLQPLCKSCNSRKKDKLPA